MKTVAGRNRQLRGAKLDDNRWQEFFKCQWLDKVLEYVERLNLPPLKHRVRRSVPPNDLPAAPHLRRVDHPIRLRIVVASHPSRSTR
jgi:hypothetical protein